MAGTSSGAAFEGGGFEGDAFEPYQAGATADEPSRRRAFDGTSGTTGIFEDSVARRTSRVRARLSSMAAAGMTRLNLALPRLDPGVPGLRVLAAVGLLAAVVAGAMVWRSRPVVEPMAPPVPLSGSAATSATSATWATSAPSPSPTPGVIVYVTGKVRKPGVLSLATGSRVIDAIRAAGGVRKGASPGGVNLARRLVDGEQIVVGDGAGMGAGVQQATGSGESQVVNLNAATVEQLNSLPGVGDVLAQRIIDFRDQHGGFQSVDQLRDVSGIGDRKFAELRDKVAV